MFGRPRELCPGGVVGVGSGGSGVPQRLQELSSTALPACAVTPAQPPRGCQCFSCTSVFGFYLANLPCAGGTSCIFLQRLISEEPGRGVTCQVSAGFDQADAWSSGSRHRQ